MQDNYKAQYHVDAKDVQKELANYMLVDGYDFVLDLEKSEGFNFVEARTGKKYLDFFTCFASMPVGMNHPKMQDEKFKAHLAQVAINKPSNSDIYTEEMATFVKTFNKIAVPDHFKYSFFVEGGALAVENALKTAFDWKVRRNMAKGLSSDIEPKIIHFKQAFHGRSGYTMSLTNTDPNKVKYFPKFDWPRVSNPYITFPLEGDNLANVIEAEKNTVAEIQKAFDDNPNQIAGIIIEPIQGEGGDHHFRKEFFLELRRLVDENEALLIYDEVQTGVGLTGTMWAHQNIGVNPDIMSFGKKMQVCGILVGKKIDEEPENVFKVSSRINSTWGGNLIDMVRATRYLEIIEEEKLVENAKNMGETLIAKMREVQAAHPEQIYNVRGMGLFAAFDVKSPEIRSKFINKCFEDGLIILPCGSNAVRFRPPLNVTVKELETGFELVKKAMAFAVK